MNAPSEIKRSYSLVQIHILVTDQSPLEFKSRSDYMLPPLFFKRLSDVWIEEYEQALRKYKDPAAASQSSFLGSESAFPLCVGMMVTEFLGSG